MSIKKTALVRCALFVLLVSAANAGIENTTDQSSVPISTMTDEELIQLFSHPKWGNIATSEIFRRIRKNDSVQNNELGKLFFRYWTENDQSEATRAVCFQGLRIVGNRDAVDMLSRQLTDGSNETERIRAAYKLGALRNPSALPLLDSAIEADKGVVGHGRSVADACVFAMGQIGSPSAPALMRLWNDTARRKGLEAVIISAMGQTKEPSFVPILIEIVEGENKLLRTSAVIALGEIGDMDALPALNTLRDDQNAELREHVLRAIGKIEGKTDPVSQTEDMQTAQ